MARSVGAARLRFLHDPQWPHRFPARLLGQALRSQAARPAHRLTPLRVIALDSAIFETSATRGTGGRVQPISRPPGGLPLNLLGCLDMLLDDREGSPAGGKACIWRIFRARIDGALDCGDWPHRPVTNRHIGPAPHALAPLATHGMEDATFGQKTR